MAWKDTEGTGWKGTTRRGVWGAGMDLPRFSNADTPMRHAVGIGAAKRCSVADGGSGSDASSSMVDASPAQSHRLLHGRCALLCCASLARGGRWSRMCFLLDVSVADARSIWACSVSDDCEGVGAGTAPRPPTAATHSAPSTGASSHCAVQQDAYSSGTSVPIRTTAVPGRVHPHASWFGAMLHVIVAAARDDWWIRL